MGGRKSCIYFVYTRCNTHAYIKCNIDAYIRWPYTQAYIKCLAATAGNNGDCTIFGKFQPQSNNAAGSAVAPTTTVLSLTIVLKHKSEDCMLYKPL